MVAITDTNMLDNANRAMYIEEQVGCPSISITRSALPTNGGGTKVFASIDLLPLNRTTAKLVKSVIPSEDGYAQESIHR